MGSTSGTAVPQVSGPSYPGGYTPPANWPNPAVSGRDLIVHTAALRTAASELQAMADDLRITLSSWQAAALAAASPGAGGSWQAAQSLGQVIGKAYSGVGQFANDLHQAHSDMAARLAMSADKYDAAEQHVSALVHASTDPSATIVESGGSNTPVDPGYGQNWTPQQRLAYAQTQRLMHMPGNGGPNWQATFPITEDSAYSPGGTAGYTWQDVQRMLAATQPELITMAGAAYKTLTSKLTDISGRLAAQGQQLSENWGGSTALTAISQVQQLYQTSADLQANSWAASGALSWYGPVLAAFKNSALSSSMQPASTHPAAVAAANAGAQKLMTALNGHTQTAFYQMPGAVNKNLPPALAGNGGSGVAGGASGGASGGTAGGVSGGGQAGGPSGGRVPGIPGGGAPGSIGGVPGGTTPGGGVPGVPGIPGGGAPGGTSGQVPAPTQLAGVQPGGLATISPVAPGPGSGGPGPGLTPPVVGGGGGGVGVLAPLPSTGGGTTSRVGVAGEVPAPSGGAAPGEVGGVPGIGGPGPAGDLAALGDSPTISPAGMITGQGAPAAADAAAADGLAGPGGAASAEAAGGAGGFPMTGGVAGGGGQDGSGRARESWITEEEGTWGPEPGSAVAAAGADLAAENGAGAMLPAGAGRGTGQERDRIRQAWLAEEDVWGTGQPAVPSVISRD